MGPRLVPQIGNDVNEKSNGKFHLKILKISAFYKSFQNFSGETPIIYKSSITVNNIYTLEFLLEIVCQHLPRPAPMLIFYFSRVIDVLV